MLIFVLLIFLGQTSFAQEGNLSIPMDFENARVLPKGIRNVRIRGAQFQAVDKYDGGRNVVPVGNALNTRVTWNKLLESKDTAPDKGILKGYLQSKEVNLEEEVGQTTGEVAIDFQMAVPIIAWGMSEKMTWALAIPVIQTSLEVDSGFVANDRLAAMGNTLLADGSQDKAYELQYKTANAVAEKLKKYHYEPLRSRKQTRLGDLRLVNKYLVHNKNSFAVALKGMLTLPTGEPTQVNRAVDIGSGDGQWDTGMGVIADYQFSDFQSVSGYVGALAQLPTTRERRIPEEKSSKLSPDIDKRTRMDLGDVVNLQLSHRLNFYQSLFNISSGVSYQHKGRDRYEGSRNFQSKRYDWLSRDTEQSMESVHLSLGYSTIPLFRAKQFPVPMESNLSFNRVIGGRNTIRDYLLSFEMAAYF